MSRTVGHDPLITNNHIDSCAFDPKYEPEATASAEILRLADAGHFQLNVAHSTQKEIDHPNTPDSVKRRAAERIYTLEVELTQDEYRLRADIQSILAGNGQLENVAQDAKHVFEAQKYGGYFITTDRRILDRAEQLKKLCGISILKPSAFLDVVTACLARQQR
jgi:hypothetical protein